MTSQSCAVEQSTTTTHSKMVDGAAAVFAGSAAGVCSTIVTNPLDTIRVRMSAGRSATGRPHKSLILTARDLCREGLGHAFSRGLGANILASMPSNAIYLPVYHVLRRETTARHVNEQLRPFLCAFGAVACTNVALAPLFLVRTRVQVDDKLRIREVCRQVYRHEGVRGFYRGVATNVLGRVVEEGMFWTIYETLTRITKEGSFADRNFFWASAAMVTLTMTAKMTAVGIAYPYNVVMNHLRTVNKKTGKHDYVRVWPTVCHVYKTDGVLGFYRGLLPQLLRSVVSKATQIYTFELMMFTYAKLSYRRCALSQSPAITPEITESGLRPIESK